MSRAHACLAYNNNIIIIASASLVYASSLQCLRARGSQFSEEMAGSKPTTLFVVEYLDPPYAGQRGQVQKRSIYPSPDQLEEGSLVTVKIGKSTSAKKWRATFIGSAEKVTAEAQVSIYQSIL